MLLVVTKSYFGAVILWFLFGFSYSFEIIVLYPSFTPFCISVDAMPVPGTAGENTHQRVKPKVSSQRVKIHRLKGKIKTLQASLEKASKSGSINNIIKNAGRYLDTNTLDFFASQLRIGKHRLKGRRYTNKDKLFAFALHFVTMGLPADNSMLRLYAHFVGARHSQIYTLLDGMVVLLNTSMLLY